MQRVIFLFFKLASTFLILSNVDARYILQQEIANLVDTTEYSVTTDGIFRKYSYKLVFGLPLSNSTTGLVFELDRETGNAKSHVRVESLTSKRSEVFIIDRYVAESQNISLNILQNNNGTEIELIGRVSVPVPLALDDCKDLLLNIPGTNGSLVVKRLNCYDQWPEPTTEEDDDNDKGGMVWWKILLFVLAGISALALAILCCTFKPLAHFIVILVGCLIGGGSLE